MDRVNVTENVCLGVISARLSLGPFVPGPDFEPILAQNSPAKVLSKMLLRRIKDVHAKPTRTDHGIV
jgi:hypothetical protein